MSRSTSLTRRSIGAQVKQRLGFVIAQIWVPRSRSLLEPMDVLPTAKDLGQEFKLIDHRRWRTGSSGEAWAARASRLGSITAWRSFSAGADRGLWIQALPLADGEDARAALRGARDQTMRNLRFRGRVVDSWIGPDIPKLGEDVSTWEQDVAIGDIGSRTKYIAWRFENVLSVLAATGQTDFWDWDALAAIGDAMNRRIASTPPVADS